VDVDIEGVGQSDQDGREGDHNLDAEPTLTRDEGFNQRAKNGATADDQQRGDQRVLHVRSLDRRHS
jgi:hypothetical protein